MRSAESGFEVVLKGFVGPQSDPADALSRTFGIKPTVARDLVAQLPAVIQRGAPRVRAEYFRRALTLIGADVEVRDSHGRPVPPSSATAADPRPSAARPETRSPPTPSTQGSHANDERGTAPPPTERAPSPAPCPPPEATRIGRSAHSPPAGGVSPPADGWGRLLGLSVVESAPQALEHVPAQGPMSAFKPEPLQFSSGNLALETNQTAPQLELAVDPSHARKRPPPKAELPSPSPPTADPRVPTDPPQGSNPAHPATPHDAPRRHPLPPLDRDSGAGRQAHPGLHFVHGLIAACAMAFGGHGLVFCAWLSAGHAVWLVLGAAAWVLPGWLGLSGLLCTATLAMALSAFTLEFFEHVFWNRLKRRPALATGPGPRPIYAHDSYAMRGLRLSPFSLMGAGPVLWWVVQYNATDTAPAMLPFVTPLLLLLAHAPMAQAVCASSRSSGGLWATGLIVRAVRRAPLRYVWVCGAGGASGLLFFGVFTGLRTLSGNPLLASLTMGVAIAVGVAHSAVLMADLLRDYPHLLRDELG